MGACLACELANGERDLPGGLIYRTASWLVEHCIGPLGLGTLIVKPERHVTSVADLTDDEARELGPLLRRASQVAGRLVGADQVYNCLWSHAGGEPVHVHYVVQPVTKAQMSAIRCPRPEPAGGDVLDRGLTRSRRRGAGLRTRPASLRRLNGGARHRQPSRYQTPRWPRRGRSSAVRPAWAKMGGCAPGGQNRGPPVGAATGEGAAVVTQGRSSEHRGVGGTGPLRRDGCRTRRTVSAC